jgi:hypothetical protein
MTLPRPPCAGDLLTGAARAAEGNGPKENDNGTYNPLVVRVLSRDGLHHEAVDGRGRLAQRACASLPKAYATDA